MSRFLVGQIVLPPLLCAVALLTPAVSAAVVTIVNDPTRCAIETGPDGSLAVAKAQFAQRCAAFDRRDCDPMSSGGWACSSEVIGARAPERPAAPTATLQIGEAPDASGLCLSATAASLEAAKRAFERQCAGYTRRDCDPLGSGWRCSSGIIGDAAPAVAGGGVAAPTVSAVPLTANPLDESGDDEGPGVAEAPVEVAHENDTPVGTPRPGGRPAIGRLASGDLLALHYDNCPDRDDGHAIAAGYSMVQELGITEVLVVNGTCGDSIRDRFVDTSRSLMRAIWGDDWLDADRDADGSAARAASRWAAVLANGGDVWVAEGGPADFTARVLRRLQTGNPELDLKRVHVVQHSHGAGFNERLSVNIDDVRRTANYVTIDNGNGGGNDTANLNQQSSSFVATARASRYATVWNAAFDYLRPDCAERSESCKLDFSDTVELLYIVDDTRTRNVRDFGARYLD